MNYFIDFEATQFSNGIISVGCCSEDGGEFYSLVYTTHKVTPFITDLTGITSQAVAEAPTAEEVFGNMYDWCLTKAKDGKLPHFYCYGNSDKDFVKHNFNECHDFKAATMLSYLYTDMQDYGPEVKAHFGLNKNIGLQKVFNHYVGRDLIQQHNALEDAFMLREVFINIRNNPLEFNVFPEYQDMMFAKKVNDEAPSISEDGAYTVHRMKGGKVVSTYPSLKAAVKWCYEQIPEGEERDKTSLKTIARGIRRSNNDPKKKYRNYKWVLIKN